MLHTPFAEHHEAPPEPPPEQQNLVTGPTIAACGGGGLALIIFDLLVPEAAMPVELRGLALVIILVASVLGATRWIDRRNEDRHREVLASRRPGDCCAIAWVDGKLGRPFPGGVPPYNP